MYSHATLSSVSSISALAALALVICLSSRTCEAAGDPQQQHLTAALQVASEQHRQPDAAAATSLSKSGDMLRQLARLADRELQDQYNAELQRADQLKALLVALSPHQQDPEKRHKKSAKASDKKLALKRKLDELVDELVEEPATAGGAEGPSFAVNDSTLRKRSNNQQVASKPPPSEAAESDVESKLLLLIKRKPTLDGVDNSLGDLYDNQQQQQPAAGSRRPVNLKEHQRNILEDSLNIRRDSIFSTNNHLGFKVPPKFGSDEQL